MLCVEAPRKSWRCALSRGCPRDPRLSSCARTEPPRRAPRPARAWASAVSAGSSSCRSARATAWPPSCTRECRRRLEEEVRAVLAEQAHADRPGQPAGAQRPLQPCPAPGGPGLLRTLQRATGGRGGGGPFPGRMHARACAIARRAFSWWRWIPPFPSLAAHGIFPDIVVALEAQAANLQDFLPVGARRTVLACDLSSHPAVNRLFPGRLFFFSSRFAPLRIFDRLAEAHLLPTLFPALGSVGVAAVHAGLQSAAGMCPDGTRSSVPGGAHARAGLPVSPGHARSDPAGCDPSARTPFRPLAARVAGARSRQARRRRPDRQCAEILPGQPCTRWSRDSTARVMDFGPQGLDLGVRRLSLGECGGKACLRRRAARPPGGRHRQEFPARLSVRGFIKAERGLLERALDALRDTPADGRRVGGMPCPAAGDRLHLGSVSRTRPASDTPTGASLPGHAVAAALLRRGGWRGSASIL